MALNDKSDIDALDAEAPAHDREPEVGRSGCGAFDVNTPVAYLQGALSEGEAAFYERHLADCGVCAAQIDHLRPLMPGYDGYSGQPATEPSVDDLDDRVPRQHLGPLLTWLGSAAIIAFGVVALVGVVGFLALTVLTQNRTHQPKVEYEPPRTRPSPPRNTNQPPFPGAPGMGGMSTDSGAFPGGASGRPYAYPPATGDRSGGFGDVQPLPAKPVKPLPAQPAVPSSGSRPDKGGRKGAAQQPAKGAGPAGASARQPESSEPSPPPPPVAAVTRPVVPPSVPVAARRGPSTPEFRQVGSKTFRRDEEGIWVDTAYQPESTLPVVELVAGSPEYERILDEHPELRPYFRLADELILVNDKTVYRVRLAG